MIEYGNEDERREALGRLIGVEDKVWVQVAGQDKVWAIADEDLERTAADKTSSVHFLRFELPPAAIAAARGGADIAMGIDHPQYRQEVVVGPAVRQSLVEDLA